MINTSGSHFPWTLKVEAASSSKMPVNIDGSSWHHTPENLNLYYFCCKNLRFWLPYISLIEVGMVFLETCKREGNKYPCWHKYSKYNITFICCFPGSWKSWFKHMLPVILWIVLIGGWSDCCLFHVPLFCTDLLCVMQTFPNTVFGRTLFTETFMSVWSAIQIYFYCMTSVKLNHFFNFEVCHCFTLRYNPLMTFYSRKVCVNRIVCRCDCTVEYFYL